MCRKEQMGLFCSFLLLLKLLNGIETFCSSRIKRGNHVKWFTCGDGRWVDNSYPGMHDDCKNKKKRTEKTCNIIVFISNRADYAIINRNAICQNRVLKAFCRFTSKLSPLLRPVGCWEAAASGRKWTLACWLRSKSPQTSPKGLLLEFNHPTIKRTHTHTDTHTAHSLHTHTHTIVDAVLKPRAMTGETQKFWASSHQGAAINTLDGWGQNSPQKGPERR